ncbi:hypothetical protein [Rhizobium rhizogenes]|uniref:hypothetical protein n=1 Tax=Rhizobium rhizogenes TaxID=359 RepID=UPI00122EEDD9|nr:hypothetical protein [Rhizobium rhizogenes]
MAEGNAGKVCLLLPDFYRFPPEKKRVLFSAGNTLACIKSQMVWAGSGFSVNADFQSERW